MFKNLYSYLLSRQSTLFPSLLNHSVLQPPQGLIRGIAPGWAGHRLPTLKVTGQHERSSLLGQACIGVTSFSLTEKGMKIEIKAKILLLELTR